MSKTIQPIDSIAPMQGGEHSRAANDPAQADYQKGKEFLQRNELAQAAVALHNALLGFQEKDDQRGMANASNQMGHVCLARQEYDQALAHYQRAGEICSQLNDPMSLVAISKQLLVVYRGQKRFDKAIAVCLELLDGYQNNNDPQGAVQILEQMAEVYIEAGERGKAADAYRTIASIHKNFKHSTIAEGYLQKAIEVEAVG